MSRTFNFEKIVNFRSLSGLSTRDNAEITDGHIFRSALLDFATPDDMDLLTSIAPDVVVDFRMSGEKQGEAIKLILNSLDYQEMPIDVGNFFSPDQIEAIGRLKPSDIDDLFVQMYQQIPVAGEKQFKAVFDAIMQNERVIYHCSAGKDRTGVMSYLILSALNVSYDDIMANYLESNNYAEPLHQLFADHRGDKFMGVEMSDDLEKVFQKVRYVEPQYLDSLDKTLTENYGGTLSYIQNVLQVDVELLKQRLLR